MKPAQRFGTVALSALLATGCGTRAAGTPEARQTRPRDARAAAVLHALDGWVGPAWFAEGDGFTSVLTYEWAVRGRVLTSEALRFDAAGRPIQHVHGIYQVDIGEGAVGYRQVDYGTGSGLVASARMDDNGVWLRGPRGEYRRLVRLASDTTLEVRETMRREGASDVDLLARSPLVYRRLSPEALQAAAAEERAYMSRGGGAWWSRNPAAEDDPEAPPRFLYLAEAAGEALHVDIVVELPDGRSDTAWQIVSSFDGDPGVVRMHQVGYAGALLQGRMDPLPDGSAMLRMDGNGPDGNPIVFMDRNRRDGPDTFRSASWLFQRGEWLETGRSVWRRGVAPDTAVSRSG